MALGRLFVNPRPSPLDGGAVVPGGKLYFFRTGTTTPQNTYSDSTLSTPNANPVVANSAGVFGKIYLDPASGYNYRVRFTDSADTQLWQEDDVVAEAQDIATMPLDGSFTASLTGMTGATTGTVRYRIVADSVGTGKLAYLYTDASITGTSNTTALTLTGLPAALTPSVNRQAPLIVAIDNGNAVQAMAAIGTSSVITFYTDDPLSATGWTNSGTKGVAVCTIVYPL